MVGDHPASVIAISKARPNLAELTLALHQQLEQAQPETDGKQWGLVRLPRTMPRAVKSRVQSILRGHFPVVGQATQREGVYRVIHSTLHGVKPDQRWVADQA